MEVKDFQENYVTGWIKSYRSIMNKGWYKKSQYFHLWHHIMYRASHQGKEWVYKNKLMKIKRGQFITSRKKLAEETGINESMIERILKCFEIEQQIEQQNLITSRLISVLNYEIYQDSEQHFEQRVNSERTASEQLVNTIKEYKELKNEIKRLKADFQKTKIGVPEKVDLTSLKNGSSKTPEIANLSKTSEPEEPNPPNPPSQNSDPGKILNMGEWEKYKLLVDYMNKHFDRHFRYTDGKAKRNFKTRMKEGYTGEDFRKAVGNILHSEHHRQNHFKDVTPEFITRSDKLEYWINAKTSEFDKQKRELEERIQKGKMQ